MRYGQRSRVSTQVKEWLPYFDISPLRYGPQLWFDAADASTVTLSGSSVTSWADKSGNGFSVSQGSAVKQPTYLTANQNGLNTISFDGGDALRTNSGFFTGHLNTNFVVFRLTNTTNAAQYLIDTGAGTNNLLSTISNTSLRAGGGVYPTFATGLSSATMYVADWIQNAASTTSSSGALNGSLTSSLNMGTVGRTGLAVGEAVNSSALLSGEVMEIVVYNKILTSEQRIDIRDYLTLKWAI